MTSRHRLDARRLLCPMPVIRVQQKIESLASGDELEVLCTDPGAKHDIPAWCRVHDHELLSIEEDEREGEIRILLRVR
ncbi:MAG: sulfurtransferase TusA family protein [Ectothiorhodospiraceae bacterium AqS1]|nr:sulfurtransferase TusA family protein [Ectothiorhodospiraceae bacterium AqS1]